MRIGFIGAGRAGTSLALYLTDFGFECSGFYSRTEDHVADATEIVGGTAFPTADCLIDASDIVVLSVSDDAIQTVSESIKTDVSGKYILHLSGAHTSAMLNNLKIRGAHTASIHPVYTFAARLEKPNTLQFVAEGDEAVLAQFEKCGIQLFEIETKDKPLYHAAAVFASNYITVISHLSANLLSVVGFSPEMAQSLFAGLSHAAVSAAAEKGAANAITGPVARGDVSTIKAHLGAFSDMEGYMDIYKKLAREILSFTNVPNERAVRELIQ